MKTKKELLKSKAHWVTKIQLELYKNILDYMEAKGLNNSRLAEELGVTKGYVSQILNGDFDHKLSKLVELSLFIGKAPLVKFKNLETLIEQETHKISVVKEMYPSQVSEEVNYIAVAKGQTMVIVGGGKTRNEPPYNLAV